MTDGKEDISGFISGSTMTFNSRCLFRMFLYRLREKIILLFKDPATITCAGILEVLLMSIFNDQKLLLCH